MKILAQAMWHWTVANAQVGITYFWLCGYFAVIVITLRGKLPVDVLSTLTPITATVIAFWFSRQRASSDEKPSNPSGATP
jgi:hypothetical protein